MKKIIDNIKNISIKIAIRKGKLILYFTGDSCYLLKEIKSELDIKEMIGSCKKTTPVVERMKKNKYRIKIINIDKEEFLTKKFNIKSVPNFVLFDNNLELGRINGPKTKKEINDFYNYDKYLYRKKKTK